MLTERTQMTSFSIIPFLCKSIIREYIQTKGRCSRPGSGIKRKSGEKPTGHYLFFWGNEGAETMTIVIVAHNNTFTQDHSLSYRL